jgi:DNA-binding CsgD family transcriptional regulator
MDERAQTLTTREREVLALLADHWRFDEIAEQLTVSTHTVKTHAAHIYARLGVRDRREAARWYRENHPFWGWQTSPDLPVWMTRWPATTTPKEVRGDKAEVNARGERRECPHSRRADGGGRGPTGA